MKKKCLQKDSMKGNSNYAKENHLKYPMKERPKFTEW